MGVIRRLGPFDPRLMVVPFFGFWPLVVPLSVAGIWSGIDLALHGSERRLLASIPSVFMAAGLALFAFGMWQGHHDCRTGHDGLCFLIGAFMCSFSIVVLLIGSLAVVAQWLLLRRGVRPPWEKPPPSSQSMQPL